MSCPIPAAAEGAVSFARPASIAVIVARKTSVTPRRVAVDSRSGFSRFAAVGQPGAVSADRALEPFELLRERLLVDGVDLRQADDLGLLLEALAIGRELAADGAVVGAGVGPGRVDEMDERAAALDMAEEAVAEAVAFMRALDEAGNVGEDEIAPVDADDAEAGMEGGERIVGDFRLGGRDGGEKGRFPALGRPMRPASAISLRRRISVRSIAGCPGLARRGARLVEVVKWALPKPPLPPRATTTRCPSLVRSASIAPVSSSMTCVPTGTFSKTSAPRPPARFLPMPCMPVLALKCCW